MTPHALTIDETELLARSFTLAAAARAAGNHPFGALLAIDGVIIAEALNQVNTNRDITAHAETELVRLLERQGQLDQLGGGVVVASCEPCPMCVGALFWAGARRVLFGLSSARLCELSVAPGDPPFGFTITAPQIGAAAEPPMTCSGPWLEERAAIAHLGYWTP
jgi:tRNA(Arg) A34 adenosine deaminase TadA